MNITSRLIIILMSVLGIAACTNEESFTVSSGARLEFSTDTVSFDTIFTSIGSSTQRMKVYNRNSKGIRISSAYLANGGTSGFRVNIDGQSGTTFSDVEIYNKDSIYVFVEVTVDPHDSDSPVLVEDSLIFNLESGVRQSVKLMAYGRDAIIMRGEHISSDTEFTKTRPYLIYDSLVVDSGAVLKLQPGSELYFHNEAKLIVFGELRSEGTLEEEVVMRGDRTDNILDGLPYDRLDAQWGGVVVKDGARCVLNHTDIHGGRFGISCTSTKPETQSIEIENSVIHNVAGDGLYLENCSARVYNSQISNSKGYCVNVVGGNSDFVHCTIVQFYPWSGGYGNALLFTNVLGEETCPLQNASFTNCVITGGAKDEVFGERSDDETVPFVYKFDHCFLNTVYDEEDPDENMIDCVFENEENDCFRQSNFRKLDTDNYLYDFRLDSASLARGMADPVVSAEYPLDRYGVSRVGNGVKPDAGCYQYVETETEQ